MRERLDRESSSRGCFDGGANRARVGLSGRFVLDERLSFAQAFGCALVLARLVVITTERTRAGQPDIGGLAGNETKDDDRLPHRDDVRA